MFELFAKYKKLKEKIGSLTEHIEYYKESARLRLRDHEAMIAYQKRLAEREDLKADLRTIKFQLIDKFISIITFGLYK